MAWYYTKGSCIATPLAKKEISHVRFCGVALSPPCGYLLDGRDWFNYKKYVAFSGRHMGTVSVLMGVAGLIQSPVKQELVELRHK